MQGVNESLRNEHRTALAGRDQDLADLRQRVQELEQASSSTAQSNKLDLSLFFKPDVIEQFGEAQCEAMAQAAIKAAGQQAQHIIETEVKPIKDRAKADDAAKAKQREDAFWSNLDGLIAKIPEAGNRTIWEINEEDAWKQFLREPDADGEVRQARLSRLQNTLNAQGVANLFGEYLKKATPAPRTPPVAPGGGAGNGGDQLPQGGQSVNGLGYPTTAEFNDYTKRAATVRNPRDPRYVTDKERQEMEARLRLPRPGAGR